MVRKQKMPKHKQKLLTKVGAWNAQKINGRCWPSRFINNMWKPCIFFIVSNGCCMIWKVYKMDMASTIWVFFVTVMLDVLSCWLREERKSPSARRRLLRLHPKNKAKRFLLSAEKFLGGCTVQGLQNGCRCWMTLEPCGLMMFDEY